MLVQIAITHFRRPFHLAAVLQQLACQNIHQRRFANAVRSHQSDMLSSQQPEGYILEQLTLPEIMGYIFNSK
ncbi:hypothetical protein D3C87_2004630 [compost metagenome]